MHRFAMIFRVIGEIKATSVPFLCLYLISSDKYFNFLFHLSVICVIIYFGRVYLLIIFGKEKKE